MLTRSSLDVVRIKLKADDFQVYKTFITLKRCLMKTVSVAMTVEVSK